MDNVQATQSVEKSDPQKPAHHGTILEACASGEVVRLQKLLDDCGVKPGDLPVHEYYNQYSKTYDPVPPSGPPSGLEMAFTAVENKQPQTLALLLRIYPTLEFAPQSILLTCFAHPDLATFKVLYAHFPALIKYDGFSCHTTGLEMACCCGDPAIPNFYLDQGVDPGQGPPTIWGPIHAAVCGTCPLVFIERLFHGGAKVRYLDVLEAIRRSRVDAIPFLLEHYEMPEDADLDSRMESFIDEARKTGHDETVTVVGTKLQTLREREKEVAKPPVGTEGKNEVTKHSHQPKDAKSWWSRVRRSFILTRRENSNVAYSKLDSVYEKACV